jgi:hypothetical protein
MANDDRRAYPIPVTFDCYSKDCRRKGNHMRQFICVIAALLAVTPACAAPSIVGKWAPAADQCNTPSAILIGPKQLSRDEVNCNFDKVARKGSTVTWMGVCSSGDDQHRQTVTAKLSGKKLLYRFKGSSWEGPFVRCAK